MQVVATGYGKVWLGMVCNVRNGYLMTIQQVTASLPLNTPLASASPPPTATKAGFEKEKSRVATASKLGSTWLVGQMMRDARKIMESMC